MDEPERLLSVPGNIGKESKGVAFGLQGNLAFPVLGGFFAGVAIFMVAVNEAALPLWAILLISALPAFAIFACVMFFFQGKPPHYLGDLIAETLGEPVIQRAGRQPEHPRETARKTAQKR
jgi:glucose dehydrogenase